MKSKPTDREREWRDADRPQRYPSGPKWDKIQAQNEKLKAAGLLDTTDEELEAVKLKLKREDEARWRIEENQRQQKVLEEQHREEGLRRALIEIEEKARQQREAASVFNLIESL